MASLLTSTGSDKNITSTLSSDILVVAAIDFGTTYTGFAYSFKYDPTKIFTSKWTGQNIQTATEKAPTCVLLSPEKEFLAFGYDAEEQYTTLVEKDKSNQVETAREYYFFERFKMNLYMTKKLNRKTTIADIHGKEMPALVVFAKVIGHIKETLENTFNKVVGLQEHQVLWVLTVPAIWSDSAKQFMKEAAEKAGIPGNNIKLVLEPEAGSLYCNTMPLCTVAKVDGSTNIEKLPIGQKYIVADLGGGTADISVHEILANRNLREIYRSDGGAFGGLMVDTEFQNFLKELFGEKLIQYMNDHYNEQMLGLRHEFETKKRTFKPESTEPVRIQIPLLDFKEASEAVGEESIQEKVQKARENNVGNILLKANKLLIAHEVFERFFRTAKDGIIKVLENIRKEDRVGELNVLLMVGGFSESEYIQNQISREIPGLRIIVPPEPNLAVLKGAVVFGFNPRIIAERIARYTYGFSFSKPFESGKHPEELKITDNDKAYCTSVFDKKITKGDVLRVGDQFAAIAAHRCDRNVLDMIMPITVELYRSEEKDPKYTASGYGCELAGLMFLFPPLTGWPALSLIVQALLVGESEFTVVGIDAHSGKTVAGTIDFLNLAHSQ